MDIKACFKIYISTIGDDELSFVINKLGIEPGITESCLYYCLNKVDIDEKFQYGVFLDVTLASLYDKLDLLIAFKNMFNLQYEINVKFSDLDEALEYGVNLIVSNELKNFAGELGAFYCLNKEYIELE